VLDLHIHSIYSDGDATVSEIAKKAKEIGMKAIAIVDHSIEHHFGLTEAKAKQRQVEIENASSLHNIKIYSGIECGIDAAGDIVLPEFDFDFTIASIHEFVCGKDYYDRILKCMEKYEIDVIGHPFSKLFGFEGDILELNERIIDVAEELGIAIELNSSHKSPPDHFLELCRDRKLVYSVGSDAHVLSKVGDVSWSLEKAKRYMTHAKIFTP